ncbi:MAG: dihydropteroate synthase [Dehalococcoidia bacterium]
MVAEEGRVTRCGGREFRWGERTYIMGILNVTPDSFSGDGLAGRPQEALEQAIRFEAEGADIIDVGAESTRQSLGVPGSTPVEAQEELRRLLPVLELLTSRVKLPISVDTYKSEVARRALEAGAVMLNDVWGLNADPQLAYLAAQFGVPLVLMHNQRGTRYRDLLADITSSLRDSVQKAQEAGVPREHIILDPGIGFGKNAEQSIEVLRRLEEVKALGYPLLVGTSRKSHIGAVLDLPVEERLEGTAATVAIAITKGADIVRVHDVQAMVRVARMSDAVVRGWPSRGQG